MPNTDLVVEGNSAHEVGTVGVLCSAGHPGDQPGPLAEGLGTGLSRFAFSAHYGLGDRGGLLSPEVEGSRYCLGDWRQTEAEAPVLVFGSIEQVFRAHLKKVDRQINMLGERTGGKEHKTVRFGLWRPRRFGCFVEV